MKIPTTFFNLNLYGKVETKIEKQKENNDRKSNIKEFRGDTMSKKIGPVSYIIKINRRVEFKRDKDQLHKRISSVLENVGYYCRPM